MCCLQPGDTMRIPLLRRSVSTPLSSDLSLSCVYKNTFSAALKLQFRDLNPKIRGDEKDGILRLYNAKTGIIELPRMQAQEDLKKTHLMTDNYSHLLC